MIIVVKSSALRWGEETAERGATVANGIGHVDRKVGFILTEHRPGRSAVVRNVPRGDAVDLGLAIEGGGLINARAGAGGVAVWAWDALGAILRGVGGAMGFEAGTGT